MSVAAQPTKKIDEIIVVRDGRKYGVMQSGALDSEQTLFLFQGTPGSRLTTERVTVPAQELGTRIITLDRPGFGLSEPDYPRRFEAYVQDIADVADKLGLERFHVAGFSGGGPHAMACAALMPARVLSLRLMCSAVPMNMPELRDKKGVNQFALRLMNLSPKLFMAFNYLATAAVVSATKNPDKLKRLLAAKLQRMPAEDRALFEADDGALDALVENLQMAFMQGGRAVGEESLLMASNWDFEPSAIACPGYWWHGKSDENVDHDIAEQYSRVLPGVKFVSLDGGHTAWHSVIRDIVELN